MKEALAFLTENATVILDLMALIAIAVGSLEAFVSAMRIVFVPVSNNERRHVWLHYARWLVAGLTFQLAADILETAFAPTWDDIGKLAVIAAIRTGLNFFLERDMTEVHELQAPAKREGPAAVRAA